MKAMILAAGEGRRMRPLTDDLPKPLLEAGGKALVVHQIEKLARAGTRDIVINLAWLGHKIEQALGDGAGLGVHIRYSREGTRLETAGGIIKALPLLGESAFIVTNADIWTEYSYAALPRLDGREALAHLVLVDNPAHNPRGDFLLGADGFLTMPPRADEEAPILPMPRNAREEEGIPVMPGNAGGAEVSGSALTFSGISVYHPRFFEGCEPGYQPLLPLLDRAIRQGRVSGEHFRGAWWDIGTPQRLMELDVLLRSRSRHPTA